MQCEALIVNKRKLKFLFIIKAYPNTLFDNVGSHGLGNEM